MKRILFIGHDGRRTGAPIILLELIRWIAAKYPELELDLLLIRGGEIDAEYAKVCNVFVMPQSSNTLIDRGIRLLKKEFGHGPKLKKRGLEPFHRRYDAVFGNTVLSLPLLKYFKDRGERTICWVHELELVVKTLYTDEEFVGLSNFVDRFIAPSKAVNAMLMHSVSEAKIDIVNDFSGTDTSGVTAVDRKQLGIPQDAFIVGGGGTIEWRKGVDLFMQSAKIVTARHADIFFVWVGARSEHREEASRFDNEVEKFGLGNRLIFTGASTEFLSLFAAMDIFALTSREDPFPVVCLEAAKLGKPVLCFDKAGGMPEFVGGDAGVVIPYGNVNEFAAAVIDFYSDRKKLEAAGTAAKEKIESHFSMEGSCTRIFEIISN